MGTNQSNPVCLFLSGDVMTGRGIDQILPHPGSPVLYEAYVRDAREYVQLAEDAHRGIPRPVGFQYLWGDARGKMCEAKVDARIINLETSITVSEDYWPDKPVLYRMHPANVGCLTAARIDCCSLANNHVLDWGYEGLDETLRTLEGAGIAYAGAGRNATEAESPAVLNMPGDSRLLVFAAGSTTSGIPPEWIATADRPGVNLLEDFSETTVRYLGSRVREFKRPGDVAVVSIHWGSNWGYEIPDEQIQFAHRLVEAGADVVHGHSSHHVKAIEVYRDRLILYGCGDFLTDYEGISGQEWFRGDLALMYLVNIDPQQGRLVEVRLVPMQSRRFRLTRASAADTKWLSERLNTLGDPLNTHVQLRDDESMMLGWP